MQCLVEFGEDEKDESRLVVISGEIWQRSLFCIVWEQNSKGLIAYGVTGGQGGQQIARMSGAKHLGEPPNWVTVPLACRLAMD